MTGAVACPACGRDVFVTAGSGEVCPACGWRDDPNGRADPDLPGDAGVSLSEARRNVAAFDRAIPPAEVGGS